MLAVAFIFVVLLVIMGFKMDKPKQRIARLEHRVNLIFDHLDIEEFGTAQLEAVGELARQGKKIKAIKLYREITGAGLQEAKDAVEAMPGGR
ncbi:ribosomal protein L7/L12 [Allosalinactinospora lopnorensis]|uniref:ribosomal protein L7/L12 n=1 Tax=Allosalinactinospora lopnorensis TaxID=1352348 RepID=UPI00138F60F8|nr:ribosomal protein L7/L12 [Allosalinactinospora lopnorensis]